MKAESGAILVCLVGFEGFSFFFFFVAAFVNQPSDLRGEERLDEATFIGKDLSFFGEKRGFGGGGSRDLERACFPSSTKSSETPRIA